MQDPFTGRLANRMRGLSSSAIREILKIANQPGVTSFAGGLPAPELFPIEELRAAADRVLTEHGAQALQYGPTEGIAPLRELIAEQASAADPHAPPVSPEQVLVTTGSQQALDLIAKLFIDPGDAIITEDPSYLGALQSFRLFQPEYLTV